ncbi:MAG: hypothetical protein QOD12_2673, partial [Verrucomicrobiota bacterium]
AFISGMICSAVSRLAKDMRKFPVGGESLTCGFGMTRRKREIV